MDTSVILIDITYGDCLFKMKHYEKVFQPLLHREKLYFL